MNRNEKFEFLFAMLISGISFCIHTKADQSTDGEANRASFYLN
jgi:hypothetical protein